MLADSKKVHSVIFRTLLPFSLSQDYFYQRFVFVIVQFCLSNGYTLKTEFNSFMTHLNDANRILFSLILIVQQTSEDNTRKFEFI